MFISSRGDIYSLNYDVSSMDINTAHSNPACTEPLVKRLSSASVQGCINVF